ncbi:30S ribosomal protein S1 [Acaryochloris thomasi RCC1774]|uniref:30S ribosomal protein S1 n=1 Tax=Acaryochloris thomasi RCC1774 TaxID=1764569 RepID=A0A2W1JS38_9CYAN|nr:S1 RNA-binding domain-containing protein [Acaryochloris thomasi]PZD72794.1 30S ribosomal protein S1 [Acaryochloris thomasi RCC1774]
MTFSADDFAQALAQHDFNFEVGQTVHGKPVSHDNDGVYVDIGGKATAFLPPDEISRFAQPDLEVIVPLHEDREFLIVKGEDAEGKVTLSIRRLEIKALWGRLAELEADSQTIEVYVTGLNKGGVTVDVEGLRGFIPRSHLVERDNLEALKGQTLTAGFLEVDPDRNKLVLSNRQAMRSTRIGELEIGQLVSGTVRDLKPFGAFVDLQGVSGLLHIKQVSQTYISDLTKVLTVGDSIKAIVLDLDPGRGRISLSTQVLENRPGEIVENLEQVMGEAEDRARRHQEKLRQASQ